MKKALISGCLGQDGVYLTYLLSSMGYEVHGIIRRSTHENTSLKESIGDRAVFHYGDMIDSGSLENIIKEVMPDEVYNLAAQSHVGMSFDIPEYTFEVNAIGTIKLLEAVRKFKPDARFYQASTSELFGKVAETPQNESTPFRPRSPYGVSKLAAHWATINAREAYGIHASCGILFNHESPYRGEQFVTRKITKAVARIALKKQDSLYLGNLDAYRDWGFAGDYVEAMYFMLQRKKPDDYVIATGETHSIRDFLTEAFGFLGMNWEDYVKIDKKMLRPADVDVLKGDPSKATEVLGWKPKTSFKELVKMMVESDIKKESHENSLI